MTDYSKDNYYQELAPVKGWRVFVSKHGSFHATNSKFPEADLKADTFEGIEEATKSFAREKRRFTPIEVIHVDSLIQGRLTSRVAKDPEYCYFSHKDDYGKHVHTQNSIETRWGYRKDQPWNFVKPTPKNLEIRADILIQKKAIKKIEEAIAALRLSFTEPVTWKTIAEAAGEEYEE